MKKLLWDILQRLAKIKSSLTSFVGGLGKKNSVYVDLAPTDKADQSEIYSDALLEATRNPNVYNIALTGPYGSGKSSIIKTFLKRYRKFWFFKKPVLQISLAAFLPEADGSVTTDNKKEEKKTSDQKNETEKVKKGSVSKQEIERSILQQMLYGADASKLPLSRFKRIQSPRWWSRLVSLLIIFGLLACWQLMQKWPQILDGSFFKPLDHTNWLNLACFAVGFIFIWQMFHHIYIKSLGISLKSISLKDIEISPETAEEESILNRHLDEIIYFFQSTKYDLVIVEDLDRFNNPDIFVTLREINSLVNANAGVKRQIRFLYALRDNMFVNTDRTKFFEFIVPVIPIINSSNSIDKIIEQGERLSLDDLDRQFLREVSRYLNDLRLIQNIFNEYTIYVKNLATDDENILDSNKLLALLIYKNVFPSDFEELHREKGKLAEILNKHDALIADAEAQFKYEISVIEQEINDAEKQVPTDFEELRRIYASALISKMPHGYAYIEFKGNNRTPIQSLWDHEEFAQLFEMQEIWCWNIHNQRERIQVSDLQSTVDSERSYEERKEEIEFKLQANKDQAANTIRELRTKLSNLRVSKFNEIIRRDTHGTVELFDAFGENSDLVRFLVFEGFLDDSYYQYTSLFHSGRLSPNDNKFLIQIRAFRNPEPDFQIDNPQEVIAAMRETDFQQNFGLNRVLVDCMFDTTTEYKEKINQLVGFVSSNFDECEAFLSTYYETGKHVAALTSTLIDKWAGFIPTILSSSEKIAHVSQLIAHLPKTHLRTLHKKDANLSEFISTNLSEILALKINIDPERIKLLPLEVQNLESIQHHPAIARALADEGLYRVSADNIDFIFREILGLNYADNLQQKHYSTVLKSENSVLIAKIEGSFDYYLKNVLLAFDNNTEEDVSTIINVLNQEGADSEALEKFISKQTTKLPSLENIPPHLYPMLFRVEKILPSWQNCLAFIESETFDAQTLTTFLQQLEVQSVLSDNTISDDKSALPLHQFLLHNNEFDDDEYRAYVKMLPKQFTQFPDDFEEDKLLILVQEKQITFSESAYAYLAEHYEHQVLFVANNIDSYFENKEQFALDDDFREKLLNSAIDDGQKLKVVEDMDLNSIHGLPVRASVLSDLIHRTDPDVSDWPAEAAQALVNHAKPSTKQVPLFNKVQKLLSEDQIKQTLSSMPEPFSDIKPGYAQPRIPETDDNVEFLKWLDDRNIISSWKPSFWGGLSIYNFRP